MKVTLYWWECQLCGRRLYASSYGVLKSGISNHLDHHAKAEGRNFVVPFIEIKQVVVDVP